MGALRLFRRDGGRYRGLADAEGLLAAALDEGEALASVARLAVASFADWCVVEAGDDSARVTRAIHRAPREHARLAALFRPPASLSSSRVGRALYERRRPVLVTAVGREHLDGLPAALGARDARTLAPRSMLGVPLLARGRLLGAALFVSTGRRRYRRGDLTTALQLGRCVALAADNAILYRAAERARLARDRVLAIVAHDLGNPLAAVQIAAHSLEASLRSASPPPPPRTLRQVHLLARSAERMARLVRDLLDLATLEHGRLTMVPRPVPARTLVEEAVLAIAPLAERACQEVVVPEAPDVLVEADPDRVLQALSNLLGNAVKFTPRGGRIVVGWQPQGEKVAFRVADTGKGIPADQLPHVFRTFWKGERTDRRGAGLGLAIARGIVEAHGGELSVDSAPGAGSTFRFTLPAAHHP